LAQRILDSLRRGRDRRTFGDNVRRTQATCDVAQLIELVEPKLLLTGIGIDLPGESLGISPLAPTPTGDEVFFGPGAGAFANEDTFKLHSKPDSNFTLYLDFDGHVTEGTTWNAASGLESIDHIGYGDETPGSFTQGELDAIQAIWARVAEDFAPFDVNITTEEPGYEALRKDDSGTDTQWGGRAVMTTDTWASCGCGGFAYRSWSDSVDEPSFVFNGGISGASETISHEVGHQLGLGHDGLTTSEYYGGHGSGTSGWGPIMGAPFSKNITQWSRGEYFNASNTTQEDLVVLTTTNGFDYRVDDYGNDIASAQDLFISNGTNVSAFGIIERNTDVDYFRFETGGGNVSFSLKTQADRPNLDI
jgi:hypothetical protein